ncbi:MAG: DUF7594 domain-containing protein [Candidatus Sumerlaeaceae bacterium]
MRFPVLLSRLVLCTTAGLFPISVFGATASVTVENIVAGKTPKYIGYNFGHYMPGSSTSGWLERSGANCLRVWANPSYFEPEDDIAGKGDGVTDSTSFESRKTALRADPLNPAYIDWSYFNYRFANSTMAGGVNRCNINYALGELNRLNVTPLMVVHRTGWSDENDWAEKWEHWQYYYALAFHFARNYNVTLYETFNEPDLDPIDGPSQLSYTRWMRYAGDAIRSATSDVNRIYGKSLTAQVLAPTITHSADSRGNYHMDADPDSDPRDDVYGWGQRTLSFLRTDYRGNSVTYDVFNIFSTHKYGKLGGDFYDEIAMINSKMKSYTPTGVALPVFYTEFNRYSSTDWEVNHADVTLNTPYVFTDIALIFGKSMLQSVYGMIGFKFSNTWREAGGVDYGPMPTGFHYTEHDSAYDTLGARKAADVVKFVGKGFRDQRNRYKTSTSSSNSAYNAYTAYDSSRNCYYVLAINSASAESCSTAFNMSGLDIYTNTIMSVEEVSDGRQGEVVSLVTMPSTKSFTLTQPQESVWLLTVPKGPVLTEIKITPIADAQVQGGTSGNLNFGADTAMRVKRSSSHDLDRASYLKFTLSGAVPTGVPVKRAILRCYGSNVMDSEDFQFHAYGLNNDNWAENTITWNNAPNLHATASRITDIPGTASPLGHMTFDDVAKTGRVEVTDFVNRQLADRVVTFALARELRYSSDTADDNRHATLNTREAASNRPYLELWY